MLLKQLACKFIIQRQMEDFKNTFSQVLEVVDLEMEEMVDFLVSIYLSRL